jgi:hypothetical protein
VIIGDASKDIVERNSATVPLCHLSVAVADHGSVVHLILVEHHSIGGGISCLGCYELMLRWLWLWLWKGSGSEERASGGPDSRPLPCGSRDLRAPRTLLKNECFTLKTRMVTTDIYIKDFTGEVAWGVKQVRKPRQV